MGLLLLSGLVLMLLSFLPRWTRAPGRCWQLVWTAAASAVVLLLLLLDQLPRGF